MRDGAGCKKISLYKKTTAPLIIWAILSFTSTTTIQKTKQKAKSQKTNPHKGRRTCTRYSWTCLVLSTVGFKWGCYVARFSHSKVIFFHVMPVVNFGGEKSRNSEEAIIPYLRLSIHRPPLLSHIKKNPKMTYILHSLNKNPPEKLGWKPVVVLTTTGPLEFNQDYDLISNELWWWHCPAMWPTLLQDPEILVRLGISRLWPQLIFPTKSFRS